jgi:hypothetical protein
MKWCWILSKAFSASIETIKWFLSLLPETFIEGAVYSPSYVFGTFVKNKVGIDVWIHIQVLDCVPLLFISVFVTVPCCFYCYGSAI